jgi:Methyltransferase domain
VSLPDFELIDFTIDRFMQQLEGWCTPDKAKRMARLVVEGLHPVSVELGVFGGRSLLALGIAHRYGLGYGMAYGIDPYTADAALEGGDINSDPSFWRNLDWPALQRQAMFSAKLFAGESAQIVVGRSCDVVGRYRDRSIGVLHQDGNHSAAVSSDEVRLWVSKLADGGCWIMDDTDFPTVHAAQKMMVSSGFSKVEDHVKWAVFRRTG